MIHELKDKIDKLITKKELLEDQLKGLKQKKSKYKRLKIMQERALEIIKDTSLKTQQELEFHLSDMVTAGLNAVFEDPYEFYVKFEERRNRIECDLFFKKGDELIDPLRFSGLGAADVASFCLRCAAWSMDKGYRNTLILDEPFKHLSVSHHEKAGAMVKMLSEKLNLQIIMISHSEKITEHADRVFKVELKKKVSKVTQL